MYAFHKCQCPECTKPAITLYDDDGKIMDAPNWCYEHSPDKDFVRENLRKYLQSHDRIIGMNAEGLKIENWNISGKRFYGCNFQHCTFANLHGDNLRLRMCMLDFSVFTDCSFLHGNTQFCSFAGSKFVHVLFTNSDMIHNN
ncbi:MAG: pentapeptide repeat-containing protein, partial [Treponema sp.]|nr:pentapeptide repeat-containing protein [Treponema sp.]